MLKYGIISKAEAKLAGKAAKGGVAGAMAAAEHVGADLGSDASAKIAEQVTKVKPDCYSFQQIPLNYSSVALDIRTHLV